MTRNLVAPCGAIIGTYQIGEFAGVEAQMKAHRDRCTTCAEIEMNRPGYIDAPYVPIYHTRPEVYDEFMGLPPKPCWGFRRILWHIHRWRVRRQINKVCQRYSGKVLKREYFDKVKL